MLDQTTLQELFSRFGLNPLDWHCVAFGSGLINSTWVLRDRQGVVKYILQKINHQVFKRPEDLAYNLKIVGEHLEKYHPEYLFVHPLMTLDGATYVHIRGGAGSASNRTGASNGSDVSGDSNGSGAPGATGGEYFRIFPFVRGSKTLDVVSRPEQAYEAARSFARFSHQLADLDPKLLRETLPGFHDLGERYRAFQKAQTSATPERHAEAAKEIYYLENHAHYVSDLEALKASKDFPLRVMHHDTKISNILFDDADRALCVIDLDTVMPGYFLSDVGDMMRTYLPPVSEEEQDLALVKVRPEYFRAIVAGYLNGMEGSLTALEQQQFLFAGRFMIYMQALRFLTDYLEGDVYYGSRYPGHNLVRARNQVRLLQSFNASEETLRGLLREVLPVKA